MLKPIQLSDKTRELIVKIGPTVLPDFGDNQDSIEPLNLLAVLNNLKTKDQPKLFLLESLKASLLRDLRCSLTDTEKKQKQIIPPSKTSIFSRAMFWFLTIGGTFLAICEGYDGIVSLLPLVTIPMWVGQLALSVFAALSVVAFYAFDLGQVSENLGVTLPEVRRMLDVLFDQSQEINLIRKKIKKSNSSLEELNYCSSVLDMLSKCQIELNARQKEFTSRFDNRYLFAAKIVAAVVTGLMYFSGGFFISQIPSVAFFALVGITLTATAWPVIVVSTAIGLAAFGVYWYVQRPGVDSFVANLFGLDKKKIEALDNRKIDILGKDESGLERLNNAKADIDSTVQILLEKQKAPDLAEQTLLQEPIITSSLWSVGQVTDPSTTRQTTLATVGSPG